MALGARPSWAVGRRMLASLAWVVVCGTATAAPTNELHDGFYLRVAAGLGWLDVERSTDHVGGQGGLAYAGDSSAVTGGSPSGEVSVGGTIAPRVVIAGTFLGWLLPAPDLVVGAGSRFHLAGPLALGMLLPTVDVAPNPLSGLHLGGGAGLAVARVRIEDPSFRTIGAAGPGFTAHFGYDFPTSSRWCVGLVARGSFAVISGEQGAPGVTGHEHDVVTSLVAALTVVYH